MKQQRKDWKETKKSEIQNSKWQRSQRSSEIARFINGRWNSNTKETAIICWTVGKKHLKRADNYNRMEE